MLVGVDRVIPDECPEREQPRRVEALPIGVGVPTTDEELASDTHINGWRRWRRGDSDKHGAEEGEVALPELLPILAVRDDSVLISPLHELATLVGHWPPTGQ